MIAAPVLAALAFGLAAVPDAAVAPHAVRIERDDDARLDELAAAVRAEIAAAGLTVTEEASHAGDAAAGAGAPPAAAVVTLRIAGGRALVAATAEGLAASFSGDVNLGPAGTERRAANRAALQVAEWLAAVWLPPPAPPRAPPPFEAAPVATLSAQAPEPATPASHRVIADVGFVAFRAPELPGRYGPEVGFALHGASPLLAGATPFARLSLSWLPLGTGSVGGGEWFDVDYASATLAAGIQRRVDDQWALEANALLSATLVFYTVDASLALGTSSRSKSSLAVATAGGAIGIVRSVSARMSVVLEARSTWSRPQPVFVTSVQSVGDSSWPAFAAALALRFAL